MTDPTPIPPPNGYGNTTREGASAPDAPVQLWECGHPLSAHNRGEAIVCLRSQQNVAAALTMRPPPTPHSAADICSTAARLVGGDRAVTHGDKSINFTNTADAWNAILNAKARREALSDTERGDMLHMLRAISLTALDVANFLEALKIARRYSGSHNLDDYIDGAGYAACAGEIAEKLNV